LLASNFTTEGIIQLSPITDYSNYTAIFATVASVCDNRNRLIKTQAPHTDTEDSISERLLDNNSNLTGMTDPNGNSSTNQYDPFNRLSLKSSESSGREFRGHDT
jgi:YD repeat-containing protein